MADYADKGITALIFDFDGTLAEATLDFVRMKREALATMAEHIELPPALDKKLMEILEGLEDQHGKDALRPVRAAVLETVKRLEIEAAGRSSLFPYVRPMLAECRKRGIKTGIVTRNCREAVRIVFPDVDEHFGCLITRDDVEKVKPDPGHLLHALDLLGVAPEACLMSGDHPMDIIVGKRVGAFTAGLATGEADFEELAAENPDYCVRDGQELMRMLGIV
ncbi:HAD-IA family hydrolase [Desulfovibrio sp. OttesenSCG-928-I05]|nr:HAD-IA family hydrolase [Desulfovibrio sp. OttesenSCG-928-I05]